MIEGEVCVLEGVRDVLRRKLSLSDGQCDCEFDEQVPSIASDVYFAVIGAGIAPGPTHRPSGGVRDVIHSVQVLVIQRSVTARDQRRSIYLNRLHGLNAELGRVFAAIDWQHDVMSYINALLYRDTPTAQPFIEMLRYERVDAKPRMVNSDLFAGMNPGGKGTTPFVAMTRSIYFGGLRRIQTVGQLSKAAKI